MSLRRAIRAAGRLNWAWLSVASAAALTLIGLASITLATSAESGIFGPSGPAMKHLVFAVVGVGCAILVMLPSPRSLAIASWVVFFMVCAVLVVLLLPGVPTSIVRPQYGARSWITIGGLTAQPSELMKVAFVLVLSWYFRFRETHRTFAGLIPPAIITAVPFLLIVLQPDLGTASLFAPVLLALLIAAGARLRHIAAIVIAAVLLAPAAYPVLRPHQKQRIVGLIQNLRGDTSADQDTNFQASSARIVTGAGGITGHTPARTRTLLRFNPLPKAHNDMIFAIVANRWGFFGAMGVLGLFAAWVLGALGTAAVSRDPSGRLLCVGLSAFIVAQVFVTVGMTIGILPIIGVTLPFVSAGGSSLITCWIMTGLIAGTAIRARSSRHRPSFEYGGIHG